MLKVSVVLPFYNTGKYLSRCIDSIMKQTYSNYELLLINDGSTDNSGEIAHTWERSDQRIQVIDKENSGVSDSRNWGIERATGEYLFFIDADDWVEPNILELLVAELEQNQSDWSICAIWKEYSNKKVLSAGHSTGIVNRDEALISLYNDGYIRPVVWGKLYRLNWIRQNKIYFDTEIHYSEDVLFLTKVLLFSTKISYLEIPLYHYFVDNQESALHRWDKNHFNTKMLSKWTAYVKMKKLLEKEYSSEAIVMQEFLASMVEVAREMMHLSIANKQKYNNFYFEKHDFIKHNLLLYCKIRKTIWKRKLGMIFTALFPSIEYRIMEIK